MFPSPAFPNSLTSSSSSALFLQSVAPVTKLRLCFNPMVFNVLSSKMSSAIFTSCFELSCISCPLTKQKLADLMCISPLNKD